MPLLEPLCSVGHSNNGDDEQWKHMKTLRHIVDDNISNKLLKLQPAYGDNVLLFAFPKFRLNTITIYRTMNSFSLFTIRQYLMVLCRLCILFYVYFSFCIWDISTHYWYMDRIIGDRFKFKLRHTSKYMSPLFIYVSELNQYRLREILQSFNFTNMLTYLSLNPCPYFALD